MTTSVIITKDIRNKLKEMSSNVFAQKYVDKTAFPLEDFIREYKRCQKDFKDCFNPCIIHGYGIMTGIKKELGQRYEILKLFMEN